MKRLGLHILILITVLPRDITSSRWVGGGLLAAPGSVRVPATVLFPGVAKHLAFSLTVNLGEFEWPMNGSNFSGYLDVPRDLPVVVYRQLEGGQEVPISWEDAQGEGLGEFAVRAVVAPCSTQEAFFQLAAVPFSIGHMLKNYAAVYDEPFFPATMLKVVKTATKMLPGSKQATSTLAKRVKLVVQDVGGFGMGMLPFYSAMRFNPAEDPVCMPEVDVIRRALGNFMEKGRLPVVKSAANYPAALLVAAEGDKNEANILPLLRTPWSGLLDPGLARGQHERGRSFYIWALTQAAAPTQALGWRRSCMWGFDLVIGQPKFQGLTILLR